MTRCSRLIASGVFFCAFAAAAAAADFARDVRPVFQKKCVACHGAANQMNGLRLDDGEAALKGGYSGVAIVKGKAADSKLIERVTSSKDGFRMPPAGPRLTEAEVAALREWIDAGAVWPVTAAKGAALKTDWWSFQPVKRPAVPSAAVAARSSKQQHPIDAFVLKRLEAEGLTPSPEADRATLLRRLSLDLTGLPPTPTELADYLADSSPNAYERQVDRLLRSPHYGERWARQWLDLAHYADSDGYEKDQVRTWAWRYRHWVIDAFNRDLPFDRFTIEQLAGDLIPGASIDQRVATGFLRNTLTNREAGVDRDEARFEQLVNRTNTLATTWLGLTMGCSQCHNHKYDPLSQQDFYRMLSFFERTEEAEINAPLPGEVGPYLAALPEYDKKRAALLAEYEVPMLQPQWEAKIMMAIDDPGQVPEWDFALTSMKAMFDRCVRVMKTPPAERSERDRRRLADYFVFSNSTTIGLDKAKIEKLKELRKKLTELNATLPPLSQAPVMTDDPGTLPTRIRIRGDWKNKGIEVDSGVPMSLPQLKSNPASRLDLARWLVSRDNPLTARVWVNRAWRWMAGQAEARQIYNFTLTRVDALASGGLLALWLARPGDRARRLRILASVAAISLMTVAASLASGASSNHMKWTTWGQVAGFSGVALGCASLVGWSQLSAPSHALNRHLARRALVFFGKYSYAMYVFHIWVDAIARAVKIHPGTSGASVAGSTTPAMLLYFAAFLAVTSAVAVASWHLVEKRFLALKRHFAFGDKQPRQSTP